MKNKCPNCNSYISKDDKFCTNCGFDLSNLNDLNTTIPNLSDFEWKDMNKVIFILFILFIGVLVFIAINNSGNGNAL